MLVTATGAAAGGVDLLKMTAPGRVARQGRSREGGIRLPVSFVHDFIQQECLAPMASSRPLTERTCQVYVLWWDRVRRGLSSRICVRPATFEPSRSGSARPGWLFDSCRVYDWAKQRGIDWRILLEPAGRGKNLDKGVERMP